MSAPHSPNCDSPTAANCAAPRMGSRPAACTTLSVLLRAAGGAAAGMTAPCEQHGSKPCLLCLHRLHCVTATHAHALLPSYCKWIVHTWMHPTQYQWHRSLSSILLTLASLRVATQLCACFCFNTQLPYLLSPFLAVVLGPVPCLSAGCSSSALWAAVYALRGCTDG